jgi:hypothetical protein
MRLAFWEIREWESPETYFFCWALKGPEKERI